MALSTALSAGVQLWAAGAAGAAAVRRGQGCPVPDTDGSSRRQQTHCRPQLSMLAQMVASQGKHV